MKSQALLPAGFDIRHCVLQREGRTLIPLALADGALIVFAAGYQDEYTGRDALFVRNTSAPTAAGHVPLIEGLFDAAQPVERTTAAVARLDFHDVYFDFGLRPYSFTPWFSSKYLSGGSMQAFVLDAPFSTEGVSSGAALTVNVWSLTQADGMAADHALLLVTFRFSQNLRCFS